MNKNLILPNFSPIKTIALGSLVGLLLIIYLTYFSLQQPWLGIHIQYQPGQPSLHVNKVFKNSPASNIISPGDEIIAVKKDNKIIAIDSLLNLQEPAFLPTYQAHNKFTQLQDEFYSIFNKGTFTLILKDKSVDISPQSSRPLSSLPFKSYWLIMFFGFTAFVIGLNIWSFRRGIIVSRILAVAGTGLFIGASFNAVTLAREIALSENFYYTISSISHFGIILLAFSTIAILWHYPHRISPFPATSIIYLVGLLIWINQTWQITLMPFHAYYFHFLIDFIFLAAFAIRQWHRARESTADQSALLWLLITLLISLGLTIVLFYIPTIYSAQPILPVSATYFSALLLFLGLAMGVVKFRLFDLPSVWMEVWVLIIGGGLLLLVDIALVYLIHLTSGVAFILSAMIVGWIYFPARQWLSINILKLKPKSIEHYFPLLIEQLITTQSSQSFDKKWNDILHEVFLPLEIKTLSEQQENIIISDNGIQLHVPSLDKKSSLLLIYKDLGNKLYTNNDIELCQSLYELTRYTANIKKDHEEGAHEERSRIARDLHDDIAAQLLTLIHRSKDNKTIEKSRSILKSLRQTIYSLDTDTSINLNAVLENIYQLCTEKTNLANLEFSWESIIFPDEIMLSTRQQINLHYCFDEILSNIIKYSNASKITLIVNMQNSILNIELCDDDLTAGNDNWRKDDGLNNITTRIQEINGDVRWYFNHHIGDTRAQQGCCINLKIPL